jgi:hypothetical protein
MTEPQMTVQEVIETRAEILNKYGGTGNPLADLMVKVCDQLIALLGPEPEWKAAAEEGFEEALDSGRSEKERGSLPFRGEA